jgi:Protein of unknown function (DUF1285).
MTDTPLFIDRETIRLTANGIFLSDGEEITHARTVEAFHHFLDRDETGYFIRIGRDFKRIEVEDTARFVSEIAWIGAPGTENVELTLLDGSRERLDPETLTYRTDRLTCRVLGGKEEAKFLRKPYLELLMRALAEGDGYALSIGGRTIRLG